MSQRLFLFVTAFLCAVWTGDLYAERVRHVIDGDTFILQNNQRVRMIGIDAPEIDNRKWGKRGEPFGKESTEYLRHMIQGKEVILKPGAEPYDRYGRRLAYVYLPDGSFVDLKMIENGYAETYRKIPFEFRDEFLEAERRAKEAKRGMWADRPPTWTEQITAWFRGLNRKN